MGYPVNDGLASVVKFFYDRLPDVLDVNLTASVVILFVLCMRQFLKGAPKIFSYALWGIVLLRLLVPVSVESPVSFVPQRGEFTSSVDVNAVLPEFTFETGQDRADNEWQLQNSQPGEPLVQTAHSLDPQGYLTIIWMGGMSILLLRSILSYLGLRKRVKVNVSVQKGIFLADDIDTPFVMGFFQPKIYLPGTLDPDEQKYIIAHEKHHIRRGDHIYKALGYLALILYWFNPLVWVAFVYAGRDMEMSCDEAVIRKLGEAVRADYSASLMNLSTGRKSFSAVPLAFGEEDPVGRVKNLARWKRPAVWVILICLCICAIAAVCLLTDPETGFPEEFQQYFILHKKAELLSGVSQEEYADSQLEVTFVGSSGPTLLQLELWYRENEDSSWICSDTAVLQMQDTHSFTVPSGVRFAVAATAEEGRYGYATVRISHYPRIVLDEFERAFLTDPNTKDASELASAWTVPAETQAPEPSDTYSWGVSIQPERVSRTGATAAFSYGGSIPGEEGAELTYGDYLQLDRMVDGQWVPVEELPGYEYYVGDSSYPVVDGYGMVHEWDRRFGELPDGTYRMGKYVKLTRPDGSWAERMIFGEFSIPDSVFTGIIPLEELPEKYGSELAAIDGCLVCPDGNPRDNIEAFREFAESCNRGEPGFFRVLYYYYGDDPHYIAYDIHYDGSKYTVRVKESTDGRIGTYEYSYLKHFTGTKEREDFPYDAYDHYVLTKEKDITWQDIQDGKYEGGFMPVFLNYIYLPKSPDLPDNPDYAVLEFQGEGLVTVLDAQRLEKLVRMFENGEYLGYEPKTHSCGVGLNLIFSCAGVDYVIELNPDSDICRINGQYVFYGKPDEEDYIFKLWEYLGITQWPDIVYTVCESALRP